jgi:hypothetical protein
VKTRDEMRDEDEQITGPSFVKTRDEMRDEDEYR